MDRSFFHEACHAAIREIRASPKSLTVAALPLDDQRFQKFLTFIRASNTPAASSWAIGIPWPEMKRYLELGKQGIEPYRTLYDQFRQAQAVAEITDNQLLTKLARGDEDVSGGKVEALKFRLQARHGWTVGPGRPPAGSVRIHQGPVYQQVNNTQNNTAAADFQPDEKARGFFRLLRELKEEITDAKKYRELQESAEEAVIVVEDSETVG